MSSNKSTKKICKKCNKVIEENKILKNTLILIREVHTKKHCFETWEAKLIKEVLLNID
jgi:hypothetical protein